MFFFFNFNSNELPVANVLRRGPLKFGSFTNIDCVNALLGKRVVRLVAFDSFLSIVGISPRAKGVSNSFAKFLTHPKIRSSKAEMILEKMRSGYLVKDGPRENVFIDYRVITDFCRLMLSLRRAGSLSGAWLEYAGKCELFMLGLADVGLAAMIDEATGYDKLKKRGEYQNYLRTLFERSIAHGLRNSRMNFSISCIGCTIARREDRFLHTSLRNMSIGRWQIVMVRFLNSCKRKIRLFLGQVADISCISSCRMRSVNRLCECILAL